MTWNASEFGGIESVVIHPKFLWTPDILLYNRCSPFFTLRTSIYFIIHHLKLRHDKPIENFLWQPLQIKVGLRWNVISVVTSSFTGHSRRIHMYNAKQINNLFLVPNSSLI